MILRASRRQAVVQHSRTRSYNLNAWLNADVFSKTFHTMGEVEGLSLVDLFTFIDTHEDAIVDPTFGIFHRE